MENKDLGRVPSGTGLSSSTEPQERLAPPGFDPSRDRDQVVAQCRVVAHLAKCIAMVFEQKAAAFEAGAWPTILQMTGESSAELMEQLGDILNGMDAVDEDEDAWTYPIFERAQALFGRDSDGSPKGGDREDGLRAKHEIAGPEGIAQTGPSA